MKRIYAAFLMMVLIISTQMVTNAQTPVLNSELLGLPTEVIESAKTTVFTASTSNFFEILPTTTTKIVKGVKTVTTGYSMRLKKQNGSATAYGLNLVYSYAHDYGCPYSGQNDTAFVFSSPDQNAYLTTNGNVHRFTVISKVDDDRKYLVGHKWITFTRNQVDSICRKALKYDINTLEEKCKMVFTGYSANPSTHVTSIIGCIVKNGDTYENHTLINGQLYTTLNYQNLITPWGGKLGELQFSWVVYNDCPIPAVKPTDANSTGNFGECFRRMYSTFQTQSKSITITAGSSFSANAQGNITYDSSKDNIFVQLVPHRNPMPEKNTQQEGFWNIKENRRAFMLGR
jgi:hypothetical protein